MNMQQALEQIKENRIEGFDSIEEWNIHSETESLIFAY